MRRPECSRSVSSCRQSRALFSILSARQSAYGRSLACRNHMSGKSASHGSVGAESHNTEFVEITATFPPTGLPAPGVSHVSSRLPPNFPQRRIPGVRRISPNENAIRFRGNGVCREKHRGLRAFAVYIPLVDVGVASTRNFSMPRAALKHWIQDSRRSPQLARPELLRSRRAASKLNILRAASSIIANRQVGGARSGGRRGERDRYRARRPSGQSGLTGTGRSRTPPKRLPLLSSR